MTANRGELEVWGGVECTVVRIGESWRNQLEETGHLAREDDIALIASLGIRRIRYPILWEIVSPESPDRYNWEWCDRRLALLREAGIDVIAGLVHHGSGPRYTNLLDPRFPKLLASHARAVATRYPWIRHFTPVNEPLTTARFSCLYGHWYPHRTISADFLRAVFHQCKATALAMRAIRELRPDALLVQTEDLGRTFSTPCLAYQADYENERRWLGFDLLLGRVGPQHRFWRALIKAGIAPAELEFMQASSCRVDLLGANHYPTSERYLDEDLERYPLHFHGGNGRHRYADVEAIRIDLPPNHLGPRARFREAWDRYGLPIAVTEIQHGCSRDDQLRWFHGVVAAVRGLRKERVDVRAVTAWALFGAKDWNTLLTERQRHYEPGAFDVRGPRPRRTAIAYELENLARHGRFAHPAASGPGWWKRSDRFYGSSSARMPSRRHNRRPILIIGDDPVLSESLGRVAAQRGTTLLQISEDRSSDPHAEIGAVIAEHRPWAVLSAMSGQRVPNILAQLIEICDAKRIRLAHCSTSRVFGAAGRESFGESITPSPHEAEMAHLLDAERNLRSLAPDALLLRHGPLFWAGQSGNELLETISGWGPSSEFLMPATYAPDFVHAALDLICDAERGVWHLAQSEPVSWEEIGSLAERLDLGAPGCRNRAFDAAALVSERGTIMPSFVSAFERFAGAMKKLLEPCRPSHAAPTKRTPRTPAPSTPNTWAMSTSNNARVAGSYAAESRKNCNVEMSTRPLP